MVWTKIIQNTEKFWMLYGTVKITKLKSYAVGLEYRGATGDPQEISHRHSILDGAGWLLLTHLLLATQNLRSRGRDRPLFPPHMESQKPYEPVIFSDIEARQWPCIHTKQKPSTLAACITANQWSRSQLIFPFSETFIIPAKGTNNNLASG